MSDATEALAWVHLCWRTSRKFTSYSNRNQETLLWNRKFMDSSTPSCWSDEHKASHEKHLYQHKANK